MDTFLTEEELQRLTGYKLAAHQRRWLEERHWKHAQDRLGRPIVARAYCLQQLGIKEDQKSRGTKPKWSVLFPDEQGKL